MKLTLFINLLLGMMLSSTSIFAQKITNKLQGFFSASSDTVLISTFSFNGDGQVEIAGMTDAYYFQKGDSLIVYPDKSIFKFIVKGDKLYGVSDWVKGEVWIKVKDSAGNNQRTDPELSDYKAKLLHRYYELKSTTDEWAFLQGVDSSYKTGIKNLCDSGLSKACLDYAGMMMIERTGIGTLLKADGEKYKMEPSEEIEDCIHHAIQLGDKNGYTVLAGYYALIGNITKAKETLAEGEELGCRRCAMALFDIEMQEKLKEMENNEKDSDKE
ncbi:MAG: hypothetical protein QM727_10875 [Niabella sp.]